MNDNEMRGLVRANETIRALEECYAGAQLQAELRECSRQAYDISQHATRQETRDEWHWRWTTYRAAYRRVDQKEHTHVAGVASAA